MSMAGTMSPVREVSASTDRLAVRVVRRRLVAESIVLLDLADPDRSHLPPFEAGSHVDINLPGGLTRQYSLLNAPGSGRVYKVGILLDPGTRGGSRAAHELAEGDLVEIGRPRNAFALRAEAPFSLLMAGGIGVTPLLSMAEALRANDRPFSLHYFVRSRAKAAFLDRLAEPDLAPSVHLHCDDEPVSDGSPIATAVAIVPTGAHLYVCGPSGFLAAVEETAGRSGWAADHVHIERFSTPVISAGERGFTVDLARTGRSVVVPPDKTIATALLDSGIDVELSCEQGICGTCITRVLDGVPDHRDQYLTDAERLAGDQMTICCSGALGDRLVLDL